MIVGSAGKGNYIRFEPLDVNEGTVKQVLRAVNYGFSKLMTVATERFILK